MSGAVLVLGGLLTPPGMELAARRGLKLTASKPYASAEELIELGNEIGAQAIIVRLGALPGDVIRGIPTLKVIAKHGVGIDGIDTRAAKEAGIPVFVATGANAQSVAEQALALLMSVARATPYLDRRMRQGHWDKSAYTGIEIRGRSIGLVGLGAIGQAFLDLLAPFGLRVRIYDPYLSADRFPAGAEQCHTIDELLEQSDIVSLHCPLTPDNRGFMNARAFECMKSHAILINTARGGLIDETALVEALREKKIGGAGIDTFASEPPSADSPLWSLDGLVVSPHVGANTHEARDRVGLSVIEQITDYLTGRQDKPLATDRSPINDAA